MEYTEYFSFVGTLTLDEEVRLQYEPLFRQSRAIKLDDLLEAESPLQATLMSGEEEPILTVPLDVRSYCIDSDSQPSARSVRGFIPYDERTQRIRYEYEEEVISEFRVAPEPIDVQFTSDPPQRLGDEPFSLSWEVSADRDTPIDARVLYSSSGGEYTFPIETRTRERSVEINPEGLGGRDTCTFIVQVTDGFHNARDEISGVQVDRVPVSVQILSPSDGSVIQAGRDVMLNGQAFNPNSFTLVEDDFEWTSSLDGRLSTRAVDQVRLSGGEHEIRFRVGDESTQVRVNVNPDS